jgi:hypothetical protein
LPQPGRFSLHGVAQAVMARHGFNQCNTVAFSAAERHPPGLGEVLSNAGKRALGGGAPPSRLPLSAFALKIYFSCM